MKPKSQISKINKKLLKKVKIQENNNLRTKKEEDRNKILKWYKGFIKKI